MCYRYFSDAAGGLVLIRAASRQVDGGLGLVGATWSNCWHCTVTDTATMAMILRSLSGDIYSCFSSYLAKDVEAARVKIKGFNKHVKQLQKCGAIGAMYIANNPSVMKYIGKLLSVGGWAALVALCFLLVGGSFWYYGSIGAIFISCRALGMCIGCCWWRYC